MSDDKGLLDELAERIEQQAYSRTPVGTPPWRRPIDQTLQRLKDDGDDE